MCPNSLSSTVLQSCRDLIDLFYIIFLNFQYQIDPDRGTMLSMKMNQRRSKNSLIFIKPCRVIYFLSLKSQINEESKGKYTYSFFQSFDHNIPGPGSITRITKCLSRFFRIVNSFIELVKKLKRLILVATA